VSNKHFNGLTTEDNISDNVTTDTFIDSINAHMANLSASIMTQSTASNDANTAIFNALMQQIAANEAHCNADHTHMVVQLFAMMLTNNIGVPPFANQATGNPAF
jgi:hypothetical protein